MYLDGLVAAILAKPGPLRLVAVDGPGGAGKSTFARELSEAAGAAPVVHTDDFAAADNPIDWWPRLLEQVIEPLARGEAAHYQRYDWPSETLAEWHTIEPAAIVIIEGVSAGRSEWAAHLSYLIWIETPREERLRRGCRTRRHRSTRRLGLVDGRRGRSLRTRSHPRACRRRDRRHTTSRAIPHRSTRMITRHDAGVALQSDPTVAPHFHGHIRHDRALVLVRPGDPRRTDNSSVGPMTGAMQAVSVDGPRPNAVSRSGPACQ